MNDQALTDIVFETVINAPLDVVWRNMTSNESVPQWLGCMQYEKRIGHIFYMQQDPEKRAINSTDGATHCEVLELEEPKRFLFSWYFPDMPKTYVAISLKKKSATETVAEFVHSGWDQFNAQEIKSIRDALQGGWTSHVMPNLKRICEEAA